MNYPIGRNDEFVIYSKSGCKNCSIAKSYLLKAGKPFLEVNCDDYILENKNDFLNFIFKKAGETLEKPQFPFIFFNNTFFQSKSQMEDFCNKELIDEFLEC